MHSARSTYAAHCPGLPPDRLRSTSMVRFARLQSQNEFRFTSWKHACCQPVDLRWEAPQISPRRDLRSFQPPHPPVSLFYMFSLFSLFFLLSTVELSTLLVVLLDCRSNDPNPTEGTLRIAFLSPAFVVLCFVDDRPCRSKTFVANHSNELRNIKPASKTN